MNINQQILSNYVNLMNNYNKTKIILPYTNIMNVIPKLGFNVDTAERNFDILVYITIYIDIADLPLLETLSDIVPQLHEPFYFIINNKREKFTYRDIRVLTVLANEFYHHMINLNTDNLLSILLQSNTDKSLLIDAINNIFY